MVKATIGPVAIFCLLCIALVEASYSDCYRRSNCSRAHERQCGHNGKTYFDQCGLIRDICQARMVIKIVYYGRCRAYSSFCRGLRCPTAKVPVCGSDGRYYDNECEMRRESCERQKAITVVSRNDRRCTKCKKCPRERRKEICASDGQTYDTECEMRDKSCLNQKPLIKMYDGRC